MPESLLKEFIDKESTITLVGEDHEKITGKVIGVEGYWIKINDNKKTRVINGAIIRDIETNN